MKEDGRPHRMQLSSNMIKRLVSKRLMITKNTKVFVKDLGGGYKEITDDFPLFVSDKIYDLKWINK